MALEDVRNGLGENERGRVDRQVGVDVEGDA
jgi:hypothetical protein